MKVNEQFTVGSQPTMEELRELADKGFKTVVNVREAGETEQPHSPGEEGEEVRKLDMQYLNTPVSSEAIQTAQIDAFRAQIGELQGPIFVHCKSGMRAGACVMVCGAIQAGWSGQQTLDTATQMGFECKIPALKAFVREYVDAHKPTPDSAAQAET